MRFLYAIAVLVALSFGLAPSAMAHGNHESMPDCHKAQTASADHQEHQVAAKDAHASADKQAPCHTDCPSGGKLAPKGGCCVSASSCASLGFIGNGYGSDLIAMAGSPIPSALAGAYAGVTLSGPQKPPKHS